MRRPLLIVLVLAFALAAMGQESCDTTTTTKDEPEETTSDAAENDKDETEKPEPTPRPRKAGVGDSLTLSGTEEGVELKVTVTDVIDPLAGGEFDEPEPGHRFVGIKVRLSNTGTATYSDSPSNGAALIVSGDEEAEGALMTGGQCSSNFGSSTKISPGSRRSGCLPFEVPGSKKPRMFQFALDSGFADENGEWRLR